jgi:predicted Zn-dependent protease
MTSEVLPQPRLTRRSVFWPRFAGHAVLTAEGLIYVSAIDPVKPARRWAAAAFMAWTIVFLNAAGSASAQTPEVTTATQVMVMPFETETREPRGYWLGEGSAVILTDSLSAIGLPVMRRDERLHAFDLLRVPVVSGLSHATIIRVGQVVGASQVIVGTFTLAADMLTVRARAIGLDTGTSGAEIVESGPLGTIFDIYDRIAVRLVPGASTARFEANRPPIAAFELFIKGLLAEAPATKLSFLTDAIRLAPSLQRARIAAWEVHTSLDENERALAAVREVPSGHRLFRQARFLASLSLLELKRYQEAFDELRRLNEEESEAALLNNLGVVLLRRPAGTAGPRAVMYFNEAASLDGEDSFFNLGYAYWLDGDASAAVVWLREAVRRNPADHAAHYVLGVALGALGSATEAAREKDLAKRLSSTYAEWEAKSIGVPRGLERVRVDLGLPDALRVENVIGAAGQREQRQLAAFHLEAARRAYEGERDADAIAELQRVVYLMPYDHEAHLLLGRIYLRGGRLTDAIDALKISIWSSDTQPARLVLAEAYEKAGRLNEAQSELRTLLTKDPSHSEARQRLERLAER